MPHSIHRQHQGECVCACYVAQAGDTSRCYSRGLTRQQPATCELCRCSAACCTATHTDAFGCALAVAVCPSLTRAASSQRIRHRLKRSCSSRHVGGFCTAALSHVTHRCCPTLASRTVLALPACLPAWATHLESFKVAVEHLVGCNNLLLAVDGAAGRGTQSVIALLPGSPPLHVRCCCWTHHCCSAAMSLCRSQHLALHRKASFWRGIKCVRCISSIVVSMVCV